MSMVINTNIQATRTHNVYNKNNEYMNQALTRVATGMRINSAKDGAANWAISEKMRERIRANDQANQNVQNDTALLKTAQGGIDNTIDILKTLKERAINSMNDANINENRSAIATEVQQLVSQMDDNATKVKFNGRALLNGAEDTTTGKLYSATSTTTTETEDTSAVTEPTAATMKSGKATSSVYHLALFEDSDEDGTGTAVAANTTLLTDLADKSGAGATSLGISVGDKITISWEEDGVENSKEITVAEDSKVSDLEFSVGALSVSFTGATAGALSDQNGEAVEDSSGNAVNGTTNALNAVGDKGVAITNFKVAVTYADEDNNNATTTRTAAQEALAFENDTATMSTEGSHAVLVIKDAISGADNSAVKANTLLKNLGPSNATYLFGNNTASAATMTFTLMSGEDKVAEVTLDATTKKFSDLQDELAEKGINLIIGGTSTTTLKDAEGNTVTDGEGENATTTAAAAGKANLYFVGAKGQAIDSVTITAKTSTSTDIEPTLPAAATSALSNEGTLVQSAKATEEEETTTTTPTSGTALQFQIGGEANFNIDVTIEKMTVDNLLVERDSSGNITKTYDENTFAELFLDKDTAKTALGIIDNALNTAINEQTKLGAIESRLGYTSDNITTMNENLEAADSVYRDSDIAKDMTQYMKYAVLSQASQYMLSQASQNAYSILNLLQA